MVATIVSDSLVVPCETPRGLVQEARMARYSARVLLILVALGLAVFGTIRLTRSLEPGQRIVAVLVFVIAVIWLFVKLAQMGVLGRAAGGNG